MLGTLQQTRLDGSDSPDRETAAPAGVITCVLLLSPLRAADGTWRCHRETFPAGDPLDAYLPEGEALACVQINGGMVPPEHYAIVVPQPGDEIWLFPAWGYVPGVTEALVALAIGIAVSVASHYLFRPKPLLLPQQNQMTEQAERTFSFEGIRTAIGPGSIIPVIYGTHRVGGQLLTAAVDHAYTVIDDGGGTQAAHAISGIGYDDQVNNIVHVFTSGAHGIETGQTVLIEGVQGKTALNKSWVVHKVDDTTLLLDSSWWVDIDKAYEGGGTVRSLSAGSRSYQAVTTPPTLSLLLALGEGPIEAILTETIQINGQPLGNFPGVQIFTGMGHPDQPAYAEFGEARNTFSDGRTVSGAPGLTYTTVQPISAFALNLTWEQGLFFMDEKGNKQSNTVTLRYRFAVQGTGAWSLWSEFQVVADRTATVRLGIRREGLTLLRYDIQIEFLAALQTDETRAKYETTLESVTEFIPNTYAYPNTALLGLRALATEALRGALPNITVVVKGLLVRVGSTGPVRSWSDNPAWCVMDFLTDLRYGMSVPLAEMDLPAFQIWADYCDQSIDGEKRHVLNYVLDREERAQAVLLEMMGGSRSMLLKSSGLWTPRVTRDDPPVRVLSWTSATNVQLTYIRDVDDVNVIEARYANETQDYEQDVLTWPPVESWPGEVHKQSLDLRGVTKPSRVMRALQYELNRRRFENLLLEMDCSTEAIVLQTHDLFRFSHPLPGWGTSGRLQPGSTTTVLVLDEPISFATSETYIVYVRHEDEGFDIRNVVNTGAQHITTIALSTPLSYAPVPYNSTWVFGTAATNGNTRTFRVTSLQRRSDTMVHMEAIVHNPTIYDEPTAQPLPPVSLLFNPLGPPPPLTTLVATEVTRIETSGASLRVVNLSWDVGALSSDYAPYGGATILRRSVLSSGLAGQANAGVVDMGAITNPADPNVNFVPIASLRGHVLDWDDASVITGGTYIYRVVPFSQNGVPNQVGSREVTINVSGPTTPGYYPGTPQNLRLKGQPVGVVLFEGRDVHVEWDPVPYSPLFNETFFVTDYWVEVWAPGQTFVLRRTAVAIAVPGTTASFSYTWEQNAEDHIRNGFPTAGRALQIMVWARTNTYVTSLTPAVLVVNNPPPDMSAIVPEVITFIGTAGVKFNQWLEPRDFHHYEMHLDTANPPVKIYEELPGQGSITGKDNSPRTAALYDLIGGVTYYFNVLPWDTFGPGLPSATVSFDGAAITADLLDTTPPNVPTGLSLITATETQPDGTVHSYVQASWTRNTEADLAGYQLSVRAGTSLVPTIWRPGAAESTFKIPAVPGFTTFYAKIAAVDKLGNISAFSAEVSITTAKDPTPPGPAANLTTFGSPSKINLLWTPPGDLDYSHSWVYASQVNDRTQGGIVGQGVYSYEYGGLAPDQILYFWVQPVDMSSNNGPIHPESATAGVKGQATLLETQFIRSLAADKITAGTMTALVSIGVAQRIFLDGTQPWILVRDLTDNVRVVLGRLGPLSTDWGIQIRNELGQIIFDASRGGVTTFGIQAGAIVAGMLVADKAVITVGAQIAFAIIDDAHIKSVTAQKITTGSLIATMQIGVSPYVVIDGLNYHIRIMDPNTGLFRVRLGWQGVEDETWGLRMWNAAGVLMWDLTDGAQTAGIANLAVTNAKIANAAITNAKIANLAVDNAKIANLAVDTLKIGDEAVLTGKIGVNAVTVNIAYSSITQLLVTTGDTIAASITFPELTPGDEVLLWASATGGLSVPNASLVMRIRENGLGGTEVAYTRLTGLGNTSVMTHGVYLVTGTLSNKVFVITFRNEATGDMVGLDHIVLTGLRRRR